MSKTLIQLFAKPPVEGKVKTRLIPDIGKTKATAIYQYCLKKNIELVSKTDFDYQIWLSNFSEHPLFKNHPIKYQQGETLGDKMYHALSSELNGSYEKVMLIGSDCLDLTKPLLQRVCDKLKKHDLVFIPAVDGGYVLVAANKSINLNIFKNIDWSTDKVLRQTIERAIESEVNVGILNHLRDIDNADDLQHYAELNQFL